MNGWIVASLLCCFLPMASATSIVNDDSRLPAAEGEDTPTVVGPELSPKELRTWSRLNPGKSYMTYGEWRTFRRREESLKKAWESEIDNGSMGKRRPCAAGTTLVLAERARNVGFLDNSLSEFYDYSPACRPNGALRDIDRMRPDVPRGGTACGRYPDLCAPLRRTTDVPLFRKESPDRSRRGSRMEGVPAPADESRDQKPGKDAASDSQVRIGLAVLVVAFCLGGYRLWTYWRG